MTDWSKVVREHGPIVWKTAYRLLGNDADAADCFQNAFVSALEVVRKEAVRSWPALLKRLATARAMERLRQRHREAGHLAKLPDVAPVAGEEVVDAQDLAPAPQQSVAEVRAQEACTAGDENALGHHSLPTG